MEVGINCEEWTCFVEDGIIKHFPKDSYDHEPCNHCDTYDNINLLCFIQNLELYDNPREMQAVPSVWEDNRNYHILRRMLEHGKEYEDVKDEPDLYEKVHKTVGKKEFRKVWREHERGIKDMKEYIDEDSK